MKRVTAKLPEEMVDELDDIANDEGVSRSAVIRNQLDAALHQDDAPENTDTIIELHEKLADARESMHEEKQERIRYEERVKTLEADVERLREDRDAARARLNEAQGKLKVHNSEKSLRERISDLF